MVLPTRGRSCAHGVHRVRSRRVVAERLCGACGLVAQCLQQCTFFGVPCRVVGRGECVCPVRFGLQDALACAVLPDQQVGQTVDDGTDLVDLVIAGRWALGSINAPFPRSFEYPPVVRQPSTCLRPDVGRNPKSNYEITNYGDTLPFKITVTPYHLH